MPSSAASGTQSATVTTEHSLTTQTTPGTYVLMVDCSNMVNGDVLELRAKVKTLTGSAAALLFLGAFANVQAEPVKVSIPVPTLFSVEFTLKQSAGTSRDFDWNAILL